MKIKEGTDDPVVLLRKLENISFGIVNQIRVHDLILKSPNIDCF